MKNELPHVLALFPGVRSRLSGSRQQQVDIQKDLVRGGMFALFLIPALYLLLDDFKTWWKCPRPPIAIILPLDTPNYFQ